MFDEPRRRPLLWAISLPILVATVWCALVLLARYQRSELIAKLANVAAHGSTEEAAAAVRQLASMPRPPIPLLVAAAASPTRGVAVEAQLAINDLLRRWQRQAKTAGYRQRVAEQMTALVQSLAQQQSAFSTADYPWLGRITQRIIRLANGFPPETSLPLAPQCEAILAEIQSADASVAAFTAAAPDSPPQPRLAASTPADLIDGRIPRPFAPRTNALDALGDEAAVRPPTASTRRSEIAFATPRPLVDQPIDSPPAASPESRPPSATSRPSPDGNPLRSSGSGLWTLDSRTSGWRPRWSQPTSAGPATGTSAPAAGSGAPAAPHAPAAIAMAEPTSAGADPALAPLETRALLERWLAADAATALELERELARRGFGRLSAELVKQLLSADESARQQLVEDLLALPGVDARPWLILLAGDQNADVRLAAVSMMATSNDPQLIEKAWQVALHDRDPRIANLATRLRDRQAGLQQR